MFSGFTLTTVSLHDSNCDTYYDLEDGLMSLSLDVGRLGLWIMMGYWGLEKKGIDRAGICERIYQIACLHADDDGRFR